MKMFDRKLEDYYWSALQLKEVERKNPNFLNNDTEIIGDILRSSGVRTFKKQYKNEKSNLAWRLTSLLFFIAVVVSFILLPLQYIFKGKWHYEIKWLQKWSDRLKSY